jgi:uncharacterized protein (TIGR02246 family)
MRIWNSTFLAAALALGTAGLLMAADEAKPASAEEQALRAACTSYCDAINAGDIDTVVSLWSSDADYMSDSGEKFSGRDDLKKMFEQHLKAMKGKKFAYEIKSLRMIAPGVALEDGVATVAGDEDGQVPGTRYSAVWKRDGDKWLISSVRDLGEAAEAGRRPSPLKGLQWLGGEWHSEVGDVEVQLSGTMTLDNTFFKQKYDVKPKNGEAFTVVTMVGWDPTNEQLRSWYFDSKGGFGDGFWTNDGNLWNITSTGVIADGRIGTATNTWKFIDENSIVWQSRNRQLEGVPLPETDVKFTRNAAEAK